MCVKYCYLYGKQYIDHDQMLHSAETDLSTQFAKACLSQYLGLLRYLIMCCMHYDTKANIVDPDLTICSGVV